MLKISAIILSSVILIQSITFSSTAFVEIADFVEHYNFHKQTQDDSLVEFFSKHYGELKAQHSQDHPTEHNDHQKLPLHNLGSSSILFAGLFDSSFENSLEFDFSSSYLNNFRYTCGVSSFNPLDLLQPPRIA